MNNASFLLAASLRVVASCVVLACVAEPARAVNPNLLFTKLPDFADTASASPYTALADMNGDGKPDLIRSSLGNVYVQLGQGSGSFAAGTYYPAGSMAGPLVVADFNNDGKLDVLVGNTGNADNGSLSILLGNGNGTLQSQTVINAGFVVRKLIVTDFNKDGKADVVAVGYHFGNFPLEGSSMTLAGNGNGTFGAPTFYVNSDRTAYADSRDVVIGDFNGDTWPDYVVSNPAGHALAVFINNHDGTFTRRAREMELTGNVSSLAAADFNGDGKLDLAVTIVSDQTYGNTGPDNNVAVLDGNGDGTFGVLDTRFGPFDQITDPRFYRARPAGNTYARPGSRLLTHDMDGDGKLDLVFVADAGDGLYGVLAILRSAGDGTFSYGAQLAPSYGSFWISAADLNQDGAVDLIVTANDASAQPYLGIPPGGSTLIVTTALDENNGTPDPNTGTGTSLREAWNQAITQVTPQTITFAANLAGQTIYLTNVSDTTVGSSALRVPPSRNVTVQGLTGAGGITIDGGGVARPFFVSYDYLGGSGTSGTLTLNDLTIQNGRSTWGGGIYNLGTLTMQRCTLTRNNATSGGGAIATGGFGLAAPPRAMLVNCTIAGNGGPGAGIHAEPGRLDMLHVTISGNTGTCCNAVDVLSSTVTMTNTIVAGNSPGDIGNGNVHSDSRYNLIGTAGTGGLVNGVNGNQVGVSNPRLNALTNNGGPTLTMALQLTSAARDTGLGVAAAPNDQRGVARPQGAAADIGAFELQTIAPEITSGNAATFVIGTSNAFTVTASGSPAPFFTTTSPLPNGITFSAAGVLSGTATSGGVFPLTIVANNGVGNAATQAFTLTVSEPSSLVVTTPNDTSASDGLTSLREALAYAQSLGGTQTITFAPALAGQNILLNAGANGSGDDTALRANSGNVLIDGGPGVTLRMTLAGRRHLLVAGGAALTLKNVTMTGADLRGVSDGGAVWSGGSLTINNCRITGNQANNGGAVWSGGTVVVTGSLVESNSATLGGGAIASAGTLSVADSTFTRNRALNGSYGGALSTSGGGAIVTGCTFNENSAETSGNGGAIANYGAATGVTNSTFVANSAANGGAIIHYGNVMALTHCTVVSNTAGFSGGGIERVGRNGNDFVLINNLVALNSASVGPDAYSYTDINNGVFTSLGHNLLGRGDGALGLAGSDLAGNSGAPLNPVVGPLQGNGGATPTVALLPGSPAIDGGIAVAGITNDQRGLTRLVGVAPDIGAFESAVAYNASFSSWRTLQGLAVDGSQDFANPSGDGVANIAKYAFNLAPSAGALLSSNRTVLPADGTAGIPSITLTPARQLMIQFLRRKASTNPGIGYFVETSPDLTNWNGLALSNAVVQSIDATWERVTVTDTNSSPMRFGRVKLVRFETYRNDFNGALGSASLLGTAIWTNQAVQLTDAVGGQLGAVVFDTVYAGPALNGFTARFTMNLGPAGQPVPADGISFVVGDLGSGPWGEMGPATTRNLTINFDTYNNNGDADIGIHVFMNGATVASNPLNPFTGGITVPVEITYDASAGVTVKFNGATIFNQVPTPAFVLPSGSKFGMGARTGGAVERAIVDNLEIFPR